MLLSLPPQRWNYKWAPHLAHLCMSRGIKLGCSCLYGKHSTESSPQLSVFVLHPFYLFVHILSLPPLQDLLYFKLCMSVSASAYGYVHLSTGAHEHQKKTSVLLELKLQMAVKDWKWVLENELRSSTRAVHALSHEPSL